jgi:homoserine kinase
VNKTPLHGLDEAMTKLLQYCLSIGDIMALNVFPLPPMDMGGKTAISRKPLPSTLELIDATYFLENLAVLSVALTSISNAVI